MNNSNSSSSNAHSCVYLGLGSSYSFVSALLALGMIYFSLSDLFGSQVCSAPTLFGGRDLIILEKRRSRTLLLLPQVGLLLLIRIAFGSFRISGIVGLKPYSGEGISLAGAVEFRRVLRQGEKLDGVRLEDAGRTSCGAKVNHKVPHQS